MSERTETEIKSMTKEQNYMCGYKDGKFDVLDKIRAEIEKLQSMCNKNDLNLLAQYSAFGMVLDIIDKYKAESEGEE